MVAVSVVVASRFGASPPMRTNGVLSAIVLAPTRAYSNIHRATQEAPKTARCSIPLPPGTRPNECESGEAAEMIGEPKLKCDSDGAAP